MVGYASDTRRAEAAEASIVPTGSSAKRPWHAHSRAYMLALIGFLGIFLFGYDTGLGGAVIALPSFIEAYGITGGAAHVATLQGNVVSILQGGAFFGALIGAPTCDLLGRKMALFVGCGIFIIGAIVQVVDSTSIGQFYGGRFVSGLGVGLMSMVCPTYATELAPKEIRGRISGMFQVVVVIGVAFSYWINYGISFMASSQKQWRIPIGFQLVPVGIMFLLLPLLKESPRWLATKHKEDQALKNLAWIRKLPQDDPIVQLEFAEIIASIREEEAATKGASWREVGAKGNPIRFLIAFLVFTLQQWSGQNSISYYAPTIFKAIGITGTSTSLLASGIYGIVKIVATSIFIAFGIDRFGRKKPLLLGVSLMAIFLLIIGAVFNTHPPVVGAATVSPASIAMAVMIYLFVIPYCFSVGPIPWVICSEIFNNRTRHYGLMTAAATQWLWNFVVTKETPTMVLKMGQGGIFFFFAGINCISFALTLLLPETKGLSLESMDVIFGAVSKEQREAEIAEQAREMHVGEKNLVLDDTKQESQHVEQV
ncbi:MFS transporter, SP family, sugar:H+ symporter, partial [Tremellales sp. Uapishka_1]